ncbi:hypothetical protein [Nocardia lijiangensis]|uniref:hypothetical protein n=1 Tax=Nocardia lijiangensis TaxID=299618 RepID=UPI000833FE75|nr:hypothetical protein [Nocardia lijiangensis]
MREQVEFCLVDDGADPELLSEDSNLLLAELLELGLEDLDRPVIGTAPAGTRAGDVTTVASIVATVSSPAVLQMATEVAKSWLVRRERGSIRIKLGEDELEISSVATEEERALVERFLAGRRAADDGQP